MLAIPMSKCYPFILRGNICLNKCSERAVTLHINNRWSYKQNLWRAFSTRSPVYKTKSRKRKVKTVEPALPIIKMATGNNLQPQFYDYFLVLDFEATCEDGQQLNPQEIIEFPVLKINAKTLEVESSFHQYVQPRVNIELTAFCTQLTGIIQASVDGQPHLEETLEKFNKWMLDNKLLEPDVKFLFVTCGDWDLLKMLPKQCNYFNITPAKYFREWLNIKKAFSTITSSYPKGLMPMLQGLGIPHQGRHHSGIDDCKNIGNILTELLRRGLVAQASGRLK